MRTAYTVGHSTRTLDELVGMLRAHGVAAIADVRRFAGSRRLPQFNAESLAAALPPLGLDYLPFPELGGRRRPDPGATTNAGWRNASFRAYADYMATPAFLDGIGRLVGEAERRPVAVMCAEAVPWRCHRSLVADALLVRGRAVLDILSAAKATPHKLTPFARVDGTRVTYPPEQPGLFDGDADAAASP
ncbi:MAG TPA: DUF488 domain-containing protein [Humisphaera sp.]